MAVNWWQVPNSSYMKESKVKFDWTVMVFQLPEKARKLARKLPLNTREHKLFLEEVGWTLFAHSYANTPLSLLKKVHGRLCLNKVSLLICLVTKVCLFGYLQVANWSSLRIAPSCSLTSSFLAHSFQAVGNNNMWNNMKS